MEAQEALGLNTPYDVVDAGPECEGGYEHSDHGQHNVLEPGMDSRGEEVCRERRCKIRVVRGCTGCVVELMSVCRMYSGCDCLGVALSCLEYTVNDSVDFETRKLQRSCVCGFASHCYAHC